MCVCIMYIFIVYWKICSQMNVKKYECILAQSCVFMGLLCTDRSLKAKEECVILYTFEYFNLTPPRLWQDSSKEKRFSRKKVSKCIIVKCKFWLCEYTHICISSWAQVFVEEKKLIWWRTNLLATFLLCFCTNESSEKSLAPLCTVCVYMSLRACAYGVV